ncbi:hypothetical protein [Rubripirellula lacrimiformis]|uniref:hypothetical protein n=1 Tax=Rubripirellula lacrimiformis TaxID=1930273 RepID=UPI0011A86CD7|nr:hypothetical protein [Rubripirellula lacrimiformis]
MDLYSIYGGKDETVTTDDFLLDQADRTLRDQTRRRRDGRSRRRGVYLIGGLTLVGLLILGGPSLISHSSIGQSMLTKSLAEYGFQGDAKSMRIGWVTPLQVTGLKITGIEAGSEVTIDQLDMDMTVGDLIADSSMSDLGQISIRGVHIGCSVDEGSSSIEQDLAKLLETSSEGDTTVGKIKVQDITLSVTDRVSGLTWQVAQSNADVELGQRDTKITFEGVLTEPGGSGGSLGGTMDLTNSARPNESTPWKINLRSESLPLSVVALARRRMPELASSIPQRVGGDATGEVVVTSGPRGEIDASVRKLQVRNLTAEDDTMLGNAGTQMWRNSLATLDGDMTVTGTRLYGRRLEATTDFAKATMDGVVSTTFSLVGADDNPLRWLEAIDGTATAEVDLAKLDEALPGMLPLREGAQLVSGRVFARVESNPGAPTARGSDSGASIRRSKLSIVSDALRARSNGAAVVIDPVELTATVSTKNGQVRAEQFAWNSAFGSAVGQGDLQSGNADVQIDFGRLMAMLRPIVDISEAQLAGSARGEIRWNASADNVWRLQGSGDATNLLVTLPGGQTLRRQSMKGDIEAVGRWGGQSLDELTSARLDVTTNGLALEAALVRPVQRPDPAVPMPISIRSSGRLETVTELAAAWMPAELVDATGNFQFTAEGVFSTIDSRVRQMQLKMTQPRLVYGSQYLSQPEVDIHFTGELLLPAAELRADKLTLAGDALSAAAQGTANSEAIDMEIKWRAKLERLQGSVQSRVVTTAPNGIRPLHGPVPLTSTSPNSVQPVGYQTGATVQTDSWLLMGDCEGEFHFVKTDQWLDVISEMTGTNLAVISPPSASAAFQTMGPMPQSAYQNNAIASGPQGDVVWSEPNLQINGKVRYSTQSGDIQADQLQVAGDWFAATLTGLIVWNDQIGKIDLKGPARLKMNEVATRLSPLAGIPIVATGIHETPVEIHALRRPDGEIGLDVLAKLGWESGEVAGVAFGPASIPIRMTETTVTVSPSTVAVGAPGTLAAGGEVGGGNQGKLNLAGRINYRPGPMWMQLDRGVVADSIQLTPEMTDRWLKYLAPLAANTARIQGTISADLDEALIVFDDPNQTRIGGRLKIDGIDMNAGPLANQIISGVDQLRALAGALAGQSVAASNNRTLITMPPQTVDFAVDRGVVVHDRMYFEIDRAEVITGGQVAFDGRMNMVAQVPLDPRWLGRDLQGLAGQTVSLPVQGSISQPRLDSSGVRQVVTQLATQAVQTNGENYLQKQLNKQFEKIGFDKMGLEKLFGR